MRDEGRLMNCRDCQDLAPLHLSGELDSARCAEFEAHVQSCAGCRRELEAIAHVVSRRREAMHEEEVDTYAVDQRVRQGIAASPRVHRRSKGWMKWTAAAAGVAAAL